MPKSKIKKWTDDEVSKLLKLHSEGVSSIEIADILDRTDQSVRQAIYRYASSFDDENDHLVDTLLKSKRSVKASTKLRKESKLLSDRLLNQKEYLEELKKLSKSFKVRKQTVAKRKSSKKKKNMTMELMLSDLHYGKLTNTFCYEIARKRMSRLTEVLIKEIDKESKCFNVEAVKVLMLGDIIESATMHREESLVNCEFGNQSQINASIESLFNDCLLPIAKTGVDIEVVAVTGNHDRLTVGKTYKNPGKEYVTYTIYHMLRLLCEASGLKNISFVIPEGVYSTYEVYGTHYLAEHGDMFAHNKVKLEAHLASRSQQTGKVLQGIRFGHLHEELAIGRGRFIRNASLPGADGYSEINGYANTASSQTINYYIKSDSRPTPFYKSFPVYLEDIK